MRPDQPTTDDPVARLLRHLLAEGGRTLRVGGDTPIPLDDPESVLVVTSGKVDVFSASTDEGQAMGVRHHICRIPAGQALFGMDSGPAAEEFRVLGVGVVDTSLVELRRSRLVELMRDPEHTGAVAALLEDWVKSLSLATAAKVLPPKRASTVAAGQEITLGDQEVVRAEQDTVWVRHRKGSSRFLSEPDLPLLAGDGYFPVTDKTWLEASGPTTLEGLDTASLMARHELPADLDGFHAQILAALAWETGRTTAKRQEHRQQSDETDRHLARDAMYKLSTVLETSREMSTDIASSDPLLAACQVVGQKIGVELRRPEWSDGMASDPLDEISRASRVRMRRVALTGDWWRSDSGPLLGFRGEDAHPVALVPRGTSAYVIVDPADGSRQPVTQETAATLAPFGHTFYPPFPDRPLGAGDLLRYSLRGLRGDLVRILLTGVAGGLLGAIVPIASKQIVDVAIPQAESSLTLTITLGLAIAAVSAMLFEIIRQFAVLRIQTKLDSGVQAAVWDRLLTLPAPFFRGYTSGDLAVRAMGINTISQMVTGATLSSLLSGAFSVFSLAVIFYYDVNLGLIATLMAAVIIGVTVAGGWVQLRYQRPETEMIGKVSSLVLQLLDGIAKLRVAGAEMRAFSIWAGQYSVQKAYAAKAQSAANALLVFNSAVGVLTYLVVFAAVAFSLGDSVSTGEFVAFNAAFTQFLFASAGITTAFTTILQAAPFYERAKPILQTLPEVDTERPDPGELTGRVELNHVSFRYDPDGPLVLDDVSLRAEPGEFIAIVGPSGAGKSSLFRQLLGFEESSSGTVYYDDHDLSGINVQAVRRQMGVVLQNNRMMSGTIFQNIAGVSALTLGQAWDAARLAGLDADLQKMPMGMFTYLGNGASALSGGQRQRMAIARAIASRPRIVLFDEATSALDNRTQAIVIDSLSKLKATRIVIAHRLSTIVNADRIYVLQNGRIVQSGSYAELMELEGPFRDLATRQIA